MNVSLTKKQEAYIAQQIETGDYQNASELVRDALRLHQVYREKVIGDLRHEIDLGINSGYSERSVSDILAEAKAKYSAR
jgi:antitoxin ParD1/3/4